MKLWEYRWNSESAKASFWSQTETRSKMELTTVLNSNLSAKQICNKDTGGRRAIFLFLFHLFIFYNQVRMLLILN